MTKRRVWLAVLGVAALAVGLGYWLAYQESTREAASEAARVARSAWSELSTDWNVDRFYAYTSKIFAMTATREQMISQFADWSRKCGAVRDVKVVRVEYRHYSDSPTDSVCMHVRAHLLVECSTGEIRTIVWLSQREGRWLIDGMNTESPD